MATVEPSRTNSCDTVTLLSLPAIAAWQIAHSWVKPNPSCIADLPALQRGSVWKVGQVEALWDSVMQGFPIGAFLLAPYQEGMGHQNFRHQQTLQAQASPTHMLLDGQQRANAIALGFLNPWDRTVAPEHVNSALWLDLAAPPNERDVQHVFRVVTHSHPWGYALSDPERRITQRQIRQSLRAFRDANCPHYDSVKPHEMALRDVWPWDCKAPVPLAVLVRALQQTGANIPETRECALAMLRELPLMRPMAAIGTDELDEAHEHWNMQQKAVLRAFDNPAERLDAVLQVLEQRLRTYVIPSSVVQLDTVPPTKESGDDASNHSPIETLFIRVNSAGTPLAGEELMFSMIKSSWIAAPDAIAELTHKLASPARTALLASRLVRARAQRGQLRKVTGTTPERLRLVATPSVNDFRRLMKGQNREHTEFADDLKLYVTGDGMEVFKTAHRFLTHGKYGLPPFLASEFAQKSSDVYFLLLCWIDRVLFDSKPRDRRDVLSLASPALGRRALGFLTALAWFSKKDDQAAAVGSIWHDLQTMSPTMLGDFFNRQRFQKTLAIDARDRQHMVPIIAPAVLHRVLRKTILGHQGCRDTIEKADSPIWRHWNWWDWLGDERRPKDVEEAYARYLRGDGTTDKSRFSEHVSEGWGHFMEALWGNRSMLLYAQREWINRWFDGFDPSQPEFLEDQNRPWDYDHIHPRRFLQGNNGGTLRGLPQLLRDWHDSIGNLRAWPLEANRADGDSAPPIKLKDETSEEQRYGISAANKCDASFIDRAAYEKYWSKCDNSTRLNDSTASFEQRKALLRAIILRLLAIYRRWYEDLKLSTLC